MLARGHQRPSAAHRGDSPSSTTLVVRVLVQAATRVLADLELGLPSGITSRARVEDWDQSASARAMSSAAHGADDGAGGAEHGLQGRARTRKMGGDGRVCHARGVTRAAPTRRSCLPTQLQHRRGRKSACKRGVGKGLRACKGRRRRVAAAWSGVQEGIRQLPCSAQYGGGRVQPA